LVSAAEETGSDAVPKKRKRIRLRVSIALAAALVIFPLTASIIGFLFLRHSQLALAMATEEMDKASAKLADHLEGLLNPVARVVESTAVLIKFDRSGSRRVETLRYLLEMLQTLPQADGLYIGFARDGAFYHVLKLNPRLERFGPAGTKPPASARFAMRILDASSGEQADSYIYLVRWGEIVGVERGPAKYDPRQRPWYAAAWKALETSISDPYVFFSTGSPGVTLSHRVATDDGLEIGTVGGDVSLDILSEFLARERIGPSGVVFLLDENDRLIGHPKSGTGLTKRDDVIALAKASDVPDPLVAEVVRLRSENKSNRFATKIHGEPYLVSFAPIAENFGKRWTIGAVVAEDDFVGPLRQSSLQMLAFGCFILSLALAAVLWGSRLLTQPIRKVVDETRRIREFDLSGEPDINSFILEIDDLARAVQAMKNGLRSFGAYVPKALVRTIVASGRGIKIGGERRSLTILFTDIKDFTQASESLAPEDVLRVLSQYLELLSRSIHEHGGTIDKFIGDAIMAFWNAPLDDPDHAANACHALLACRAVNEMHGAEFEVQGFSRLFTRFGLHTGDVVVGNVGSTERTQYTALGDAVNLASRIEGLNKYYGTQLLVSGSVEEQVRDRFLFRYIDLVVPAGTSRPIELFELLAAVQEGDNHRWTTKPDWVDTWNEALRAYQGRLWETALSLFRAFERGHPRDYVAQLYVERCARFLSQPPPADWDGAEHYDRK